MILKHIGTHMRDSEELVRLRYRFNAASKSVLGYSATFPAFSAMSVKCRFCCRSDLKALANSDSVALTRSALEADDDGAA